MQKNFSFKLTGGGWFGLFVLLYIALAGYIAGAVIIVLKGESGEFSSTDALLILLAVAGLATALFLILALIVPLYRKFFGALEFDGKPFRFYGSIPGFIWFNIWQLFLTIITLSIYGSWYYNNMIRYFVTNTEYDGEKLQYNGRGSQFFGLMLVFFYLPMIVLVAYAVNFNPEKAGGLTNIIYNLLSQILFIPFSYKVYEWVVNHTSWKTKLTRWAASFWPSFGMMLGQSLLTMITIFIYWPVAMLRIYGYFAPMIEIHENEAVLGRFKATWNYGEGFLYIWGQTLLSVITIGIYAPWAIANVGRWMASRVVYEPQN